MHYIRIPFHDAVVPAVLKQLNLKSNQYLDFKVKGCIDGLSNMTSAHTKPFKTVEWSKRRMHFTFVEGGAVQKKN